MAQYRKYPVKDLVVDPAYQRDLDEKRVQKIVDEFDPALLGVLEISKRNGTRKAHVFDGQHRLAALKALKEQMAPALVHEDLTSTDEAELFVRLQQSRKSLSPIQRFKARVHYGDPAAVVINDIAQTHGFRVDTDTDAPNAIAAAGALDGVYVLGGAELLAETLGVLKNWIGEPKGRDGSIISGVSIAIASYKTHPRYDRMITELVETPPAVLFRKAMGAMENGGGSSRKLAVAKQIGMLVGIKGPYKTKKRTKASK